MTQSAKIPFLDLITPHRELLDPLTSVFRTALDTAGFIGGPMVSGFEREFALYCGTKHCVGVNSGTDALRFALIAAGIGPGDIVLTVPMTFVATTEAILQAGATPDFVDIDDVTYLMDPVRLRQYFEDHCEFDSKRGETIHRKSRKPIRAVIPVHLYGQMVDLDPILELGERHRFAVIEDACQAHGAGYYSEKQRCWKNAGSMGKAAAFSFYPGKNLGACGEGGALTTDDDAIAAKVRMIRDHGQSTKYYHDIDGYNGRLDAIQAGILSVKLPYLNSWNEQRRDCAERYNELLAPLSESISTPGQKSGTRHVYHVYAVRTQHRDELERYLNEAGIGTGIHYPIPIHLQKAYSSFGWKKGDFPISEEATSHILSLPMFPGLQTSQQERVAEAITAFASIPTVR